ncbi:sensor domain-containing diguanylate cyclase [Sphingomonas sp. CROZ-RG-20F-R02-07]|uniref:sensor domain-containing diguanylate cyclase n=1 Tax=Sphingomonas sp. CROZ-RG-20F-R02-07 TaxID=2914832 RepID=UPI001F58A498|nr:sensor domain-containing diguanylate cyclase [Sphingomonas sp. CROZ-RG-20F-R02-07]
MPHLPRWSVPVHLSLLSVSYALLSIASLTLTRFDGGAAFIWLASTPLLVSLLSRPVRQWKAPLLCCAAGSCFATSLFGIGPWAAVPMAAALMTEAELAATLLRLTGAERAPLDTVKGFSRFAVVVGIIVPGLCALPTAMIICTDNGQPLATAAVPWFAAHSLGFLTFAPLLLLVRQPASLSEFRTLVVRNVPRAVGLLACVVAVCVGTFWQHTLPLLFLPLLPLVAVAFVTGRLGAAIALIVLASVGGGFTLAGYGPVALMAGTPGLKAQFFQFYLVVAVMIVLPVAAELRRRDALFLRLQESDAGLRLLTDHLGDAILHTDVTGVIRYASPSLEGLSGIAPADIVTLPHETIIVAEDHAVMKAAREAALADPDRTVRVDYRVNLPTGEIGWRETQIRAYQDSDGYPAGLVLVVRDSTDRRNEVEALERAAGSDPLTGIANRRAFFAALDDAAGSANARSSCLAIFDIDHFKQVNDRYGHANGDQVLKAVASEAQRALRGSDLLARVGGEEFAAILPDAVLSDAHTACERLRQRVEALCVDAGARGVIRVTVSVGLVEIASGATPSELYEAADQALYAAKHEGRNMLKVAA